MPGGMAAEKRNVPGVACRRNEKCSCPGLPVHPSRGRPDPGTLRQTVSGDRIRRIAGATAGKMPNV
jgi:hypothetical protein